MGDVVKMTETIPEGIELCKAGSKMRLEFMTVRGATNGPVAVMTARNADGASTTFTLTDVQVRAALGSYNGFPWKVHTPSETLQETDILNVIQLIRAYNGTWGGWKTIEEDVKQDKRTADITPLLRDNPGLEF